MGNETNAAHGADAALTALEHFTAERARDQGHAPILQLVLVVLGLPTRNKGAHAEARYDS